MKYRVKKVLAYSICFIVFVAIVATIIFFADKNKETRKNRQESEDLNTNESQEKSFEVWYSYNGYASYLEEAAKRYEEKTGIKVRLRCIDSIDYFEEINSMSAKGKGPDIFIMSEEKMQNAVLLGIAKQNTDDEFITDEHFYNKAINSITYAEKTYGYPLGFETSVFAVNNKYTDSIPKTFDEVKKYADSFNSTSEQGDTVTEENVEEKIDYSMVSSILKWDMSHILLSYGFLGAYMDIGGEYGDNPFVIDVDNENAVAAGNYYNSLAHYFSVDEEAAGYDKVIGEFLAGKIVYTIATVDIVEKIANSSCDISLAILPDLTDELKTKALSLTDIAMINPYSDMPDEAEAFAKFISYDMAEEMYELCGIISAKSVEYDNAYLNVFTKAYEESTGLPKLMTTHDYRIMVTNTLKNIWNNSDPYEELNAMYKELDERIN